MVKVRFFLCATIVAFGLVTATPSHAQDNATSVTATSPDLTSGAPAPSPEEKASTVKNLLDEASKLTAENKLETALNQVDAALAIDPKNVLAYQMRATIYTQKKLWDRAQADYAMAYKLSPSATVYKYNIAEIQFMQKAYDNARPGFLALKNDPVLGDLARYKIFLCDMLSGRDAVAAKELDDMKQIGASPGYYYANGAWALSHQNRPEAYKWFTSAEHLYSPSINNIYLTSLIEAGSAQGTIVSFTTKDGVKYDNVKAYVEGGGIRLLGTNGWITIPFDRLPDDLSGFPPDFAAAITDRNHLSPLAPNHFILATFTTRDGHHYDKAQVAVDDNGLNVLTADGWFLIPFRDLPEDLSPFPDDIRKIIQQRRPLATDNSLEPPSYSFITKSGTHYNDVRVWIGDTGVNVLTPEGWLTVPFKDLPDDLSFFPPAIQKQIANKRQTAPDNSLDLQFFTFTTKTGRHFDQVMITVVPEGLRVLTSDGTSIVPFKDLPDDLSVFPSSLQKAIKAQQAITETAIRLSVAPPPMPATPPAPVAAKQDFTPGDGRVDPEQTDLHPAEAGDSLFGSCVALEGSTLVVGTSGATYVYEDGRLTARICPDADTTHTGDPVNSVSLSGNTLAIATRRGIYILVRGDKGWKSQARIDFPDATTVSLHNDQLVATTDGKGMTSGTVTFYTRTGDTWKTAPRDISQGNIDYPADRSGHLVALKNDWAVIGAPNWSSASYDNIGSTYSGRVYVEKFDGTTWREAAELDPDDTEAGANQFGGSVALSDDYLAVGSGNHDHVDFATHHGIVYLFRLDAGTWKRAAQLRSPDPTNDEGFGNAPLAISNQTLAVGDASRKVYVPDVVSASGDKSGKPGEIRHAGAVYVYENRMLTATLLAPDPVEGISQRGSPDRFARSLAVSGDTIAIGAAGQNGGTGAVYLWKRQNGAWRLEDEIKGFHRQIDFQEN